MSCPPVFHESCPPQIELRVDNASALECGQLSLPIGVLGEQNLTAHALYRPSAAFAMMFR